MSDDDVWSGLKLDAADKKKLATEIEDAAKPTSAEQLRSDLAAGKEAGPPGYVPPANVEQQAAGNVAAQIPNPSATPPAQPQPTPQPAAQPQPAGMQPMQTTATRMIVDPKLLKDQQDVQAHQAAAIDARTNAEAAQNTAIAAEQKHRAELMQQEADHQAAINAQRQQVAKQKLAAVDKAVADFNAHSTINPKRYEQSMGVGGSILATIAKALGAFGSALTHSPNYAAEEIQRAIDRDIESQKHDVQMLGQKVNLAQNQYANFRNQGLDEDAASAAARMLKLQQSSAKIDQLIAETKNPQLLAQAQQMKAELEARANNARMEYGKTQLSTVSQPGGAAGARTVQDQLRLRALEVDVPQKDPKTGKDTGSKTYMAKSTEDAQKIRDAMTVRNSIHSTMQQLRTFMKGTSVHSAGKNAAAIATMADDLRTQYAVLRHLGALSDKDYGIASQLGDPTSFFQRDSTTYDLMDKLDKRLDSAVEAELKGRGLLQ